MCVSSPRTQKSTISAHGRLGVKFQAGDLPASSCTPELLEVLRTNTIVVQLVCYPTDDFLERRAHNALVHDEESQKYLPTTLSQKISLVTQVKQTVQGGEWPTTNFVQGLWTTTLSVALSLS